MNWLAWFAALYYPLIFLILAIGRYVRPSRRINMGLGCAFMALPGIPAFYALGRIAYLALFSPHH